jgi:hypothetical protein
MQAAVVSTSLLKLGHEPVFFELAETKQLLMIKQWVRQHADDPTVQLYLSQRREDQRLACPLSSYSVAFHR